MIANAFLGKTEFVLTEEPGDSILCITRKNDEGETKFYFPRALADKYVLREAERAFVGAMARWKNRQT